MIPSPSKLPLLHVARLETTTRLAELHDEHSVEGGDDQCTSWFDADRDLAIIEYYCATKAEAEHRLQAVTAFLAPNRNDDSLTGFVRELPVEDWAETWKKFFHAEKISERIWIKPSWETCAAGPGDIIVEIDPGMSFGTGQHGTTRGCLQLMDRLSVTHPGATLADIGCGSGILTIAAAKLGYRNLVALDNDPNAVRIAHENAVLNGVADRIRFMTGDLAEAGLDGTCDIVVANILAMVLITHAHTLVGYLSPSPDARLILSGILNPQAADVRSAYEAQNMSLVEALQLGEWTTLYMKKL
ncbi:MAG: 50S ribosomal protein L11 methyltransferase [bacterium]